MWHCSRLKSPTHTALRQYEWTVACSAAALVRLIFTNDLDMEREKMFSLSQRVCSQQIRLHLRNQTTLQIVFWCRPVQVLCKWNWFICFSRPSHTRGMTRPRADWDIPNLIAEAPPLPKTQLLLIPVAEGGCRGFSKSDSLTQGLVSTPFQESSSWKLKTVG